MSFSDFEKTNYLKEEYLNKLRLNKPENIIFHIINMKNVGRGSPEGLGAKVYAFNEESFVNCDTPEEKEEDMIFCKERKVKYDHQISDYNIDGLDYDNVLFIKNKGMLERKIGEIESENILFQDIQKILKKRKIKDVKKQVDNYNM